MLHVDGDGDCRVVAPARPRPRRRSRRCSAPPRRRWRRAATRGSGNRPRVGPPPSVQPPHDVLRCARPLGLN